MALRGTLLLGALVFPALLPSARSEPSAAVPACVSVQGEARYSGIGYDHLVHLANGCAAAVLCGVSTDVNPKVQEVTVPAGERVTVLTFRGSPAREFVVRAACTLVSPPAAS